MKLQHTTKTLKKLYLAKKYKHGIKRIKSHFKLCYSRNRDFINKQMIKLATEIKFVFVNEIKPALDDFVDAFRVAVESFKIK